MEILQVNVDSLGRKTGSIFNNSAQNSHPHSDGEQTKGYLALIILFRPTI